MSMNRASGEKRLAARLVLDTFGDVKAGVDRPKGLEAVEFANSQWFDYWCDALDRQPGDVRRAMGRILARAQEVRAGQSNPLEGEEE